MTLTMCPAGHSVLLEHAQFCGECGTPLDSGRHVPAPQQERRFDARSLQRATAEIRGWIGDAEEPAAARAIDVPVRREYEDEFTSGSLPVSRTKLRHRASFRPVLITAILALVSVAASSGVGYSQWQRSLEDERQLTAARAEITRQQGRISDLNGQVSDLNGRVDKLSTDLSAAQDEAAVNGDKADRYQRATLALANASDILHQAVADVAASASAMVDGNYVEALELINKAKAEVDQADAAEADALAAVRGN